MRALPALFALTVISSAAAVAADAPATNQEGRMVIAANSQLPHQGTVVSSIDASIYTYIEVSDANGKTMWLAAPTVAVKKGDTVGYDDGAVMTNFFSKSLNRTFDSVLFVGKAAVIKK
jgi:hypothetical protein